MMAQSNDGPHDNTRPQHEQLALFENLFLDNPRDSITLDLYDACATFPILRKRESQTIQDFVRTITLPESQGGKTFNVRITQASIRKPGAKKPVGILPGPRDELVERTLRQMAAQGKAEKRLIEDNNKGQHISLIFTLSALRKQLKATNNEFTLAQIRESLQILSGSLLEVEAENDESFSGISSPILSNLTFNYRKDDSEGARSRVAVCFHPLAKGAIETLAYKPFDFHRWASLSSPLSRWIAERMMNRYRQATRTELFDQRGYHLSLKTIFAESGMHQEKRMSNNLDGVRKALKELEINYLNPLNPYTEELKHGESKGGRPPLVDAVWTLHPSAEMIQDIIRGNDIMKKKRLSS